MLKIIPNLENKRKTNIYIKKNTPSIIDPQNKHAYEHKNQNICYYPYNLSISFKGYSPTRELKKSVFQLVNLVKDPSIKKIVFCSHFTPDCDAISSMVAGAKIIEEATGKHADVFIMNPLEKNLELLGKRKDRIKCINTIFESENNILAEKLNEKITEKFGDYDLVIVTDASYRSLIDKPLDQTIVKNAKNIAKIDHHPEAKNKNPKDYKYGTINIIDTSKESAAQIVMQLVKPFGLNPSQISPEISDTIAAGMLSDSGQFLFARSHNIFNDSAKLQKTSDLGKISKEINSLDIKEFQLFSNIMNNVKFNEDKQIAYFVVGKEQTGSHVKNTVIAALMQLSKIRGVKYYFSIIEDSNEPGKISSSIRSNEKPINQIANKFNGGGHTHASGFSITTDSTNNLIENLIQELTKVKNS